MKRLFVALALPESIRTDLQRLFDPNLKGAKWVRPEQMHMTLRFIGDHPESGLDDLVSALSEIEVPVFDLTLAGVGAFGHPARVLWVGITPEAPVRNLASKVETAVIQTGVSAENRPFTAHVTLARFRHAPPVMVRRFLEMHRDLQTAPFRVTELILYSSRLEPSGAIHTVEARFPLRSRDPKPKLGPSGDE